MLEGLRNAFKIKEIRNRIFYTFIILIIVRIGCQLPLPGTDADVIKQIMGDFSVGAFSFFDALTGSSFSNMSIFALNITPYITSTIIMQLLTIAIPKLEELQKEGEDGRKKIAKITRYLTVGLALVQSTAMSIGFGNQGMFGSKSSMSTTEYVWTLAVAVITMTAGAAVIMWLGERITEKGIGNGISIILMVNIIDRMPTDLAGLINQFVKGASSVGGSALAALIIIAVIVFVVLFVVYLQGGQRKIPVQYAKRIAGRKTYGGQSSNIPLRVNTAGVIPIIFASSLLQIPVIITSFTSTSTPEWTRFFSTHYWCNPQYPIYSVGFILYIILVIFFAYFYTSITFNPMEVADNMKKQGGFIPGIRPGKPTTEYLTRILNYVIFIGAVGLLIVAAVPIIFSGYFATSLSFGGTSLIIIVGVILDTVKKVESMMVVRNYKGFLND
ncbi:preprotein translocase subunit SecY [Parasporobacterium paucivorans]|uniref:Protein translocase subunit SecY n=1 Tax=Parasporobacterium paucivorans DSM 15970 TaxID=1122934 RepID=A0A1M6BKE8_9FIRM|nr:preprotein translocase subunit SecY [Parasporobacterium paucivorans]SHI49137.1 protein translocase subunit secY/sec61 alpha [Parasporobacterium paucivorans DSM 15970]